MQERVPKKDGHTDVVEQLVSNSWSRRFQAFAHAMRHPGKAFNARQQDIFQRCIERILAPDGFPIRKWFERRERKRWFRDAPKEVLEYTCGDPTHVDDVLVYVPGMFDNDNQDRMAALYDRAYPDRKVGLEKEGWTALGLTYSGRDLARIHELRDHLLAFMRKQLKDGKRVRILAYSMGGWIAKTVADELQYEYPRQFSLILHNTHHDPAAGFFLRWSNAKRIQKSLGYTSDSSGAYRITWIDGDLDAIVPPVRHFRNSEGKLIPSKVLPGSRHRDPIPNVKAMDQLLKVLEKERTWLIRDMEKRRSLAK